MNYILKVSLKNQKESKDTDKENVPLKKYTKQRLNSSELQGN